MKCNSANLAVITAILFYSFTLFTHAQIYKTTDKDGNVIYSDQPSENSAVIEVKSINTIPASTSKTSDQPPEQTTIDHTQVYKILAIKSPANGTIIANGLNPFNVSINLQPPLAPQHKLQFTVDGAVIATGKATSFTVKSLNRGTHNLQVAIIDQSGKRLRQSKTVSVFAYRP